MNWLRKHQYKIFIVTLVGLIAGTFVGFGSYFFTRSPYDAAMVVNGREISYKQYQTRLRQTIDQKRSDTAVLDEQAMKAVKYEVLQGLVREAVFLKEADQYGIQVTDNELAQYIQSIPAFQQEGKFDQQAYLRALYQVIRIPADEFEAERRNDIKIQKLQMILASAVKIGDLEFNWRYQKAMSQADAETKKKIAADPEAFREELRREEVGMVFNEWLNAINAQLKVKSYLDRWEGAGTAGAPAR